MLNIFRSFSGSITAKIFMGLIVLSFIVVGGIGASGLNQREVASVGDKKISYTKFYNEYNNRLKTSGLESTPKEQLKQMNFGGSILNTIINRNLLLQESKSLNIVVSDSYIANKIKSTENFQENGKFNKAKFSNIMRLNGLTEQAYISLISKDLTSDRYKGVFNMFTFAPKNIKSLIARNSGQTRSTIKVSMAVKNVKTKPITAQDIKSHYDANKEDFRIPELRDASVLLFSPKQIAKTISDSKAKQDYKANIATYTTPESRSYYQFSGTELELKDLVKSVNAGKNVHTAVKTILKLKDKQKLNKNIAKANMPTDIGGAVFSTKKGKVSKPFESAFGFMVVYVDSIKPSSILSYKNVKKKIKLKLANEQMLSLINDAENSVTVGATLQEIGKSQNIIVQDLVKISLNGGSKPFTKDPAFTKELFATGLNETSLTAELSDGSYFIAHINAIFASHIPDYKDIKGKVKTAFTKRLKNEVMRSYLTQLKSAKSKAEFKKIALSKRFKVKSIKSINRDKALANEVDAIIFETPLNTANYSLVNNNGYAMFTTAITTPKIASDKLLKSSGNVINNNISRALNQILQSYLTDKHDITINQSVLNQIYN